MNEHDIVLHRGDQGGGPLRPRPDRFSQAEKFHAQLHRYVSALRRRWWVFVVSLLVIGGPVVLYALKKPPTFQSSALMWLTGRPNLPSEMAYAVEMTSYIGTQAALIKSGEIQRRAFEKVRAQFPAAFGGKQNDGSNVPFDLTVRPSAKGSVLELRASGGAPGPTKAFLDAVMGEYLAFKKESREQTSASALSSLTEQLRDVENQIHEQQSQIVVFQMSNNVSYLTEHGLSAGSHLSKLVELLSDLRTEYRLLELLTPAEFKEMAGAPKIVLSEMSVPGDEAARALAANNAAPQSAYYQALQQLQILKAKRDEFAKVLRPTHSKMVKFNQEIAGLEQLLKALQTEGEQQALAQMENRKKSLELQIQNLESQYRSWETNATDASRKLAELDRMKQDLQRSQALYDRLLSLLQTVDLNKDLDREMLIPLAQASPARESLAKYRLAIEGILLSFLLGLAAFGTLEFLDDRFSSARELSLRLPVEVVSQIPRARLSPPGGTLRRRVAPELQAAFEESFRNLRSSLLFMSDHGAEPKVILITSSVPKEGKSVVAANLAKSLATSGAKVLLVDADFRRSCQHREFRLRREPGLLEVLKGQATVADAVIPVGQSGLFLLPAGAASDNGSDVLLRCRVDVLLKELAQAYDYVVVDSPPVLATDDAGTLGPHTDGAFLVVRAAYTSSRMAQEAWERLHRRNVRLLGVVYNCAPAAQDYYFHYGRDYCGSNGTGTEIVPVSVSQRLEKKSGRN